MCYQFASTQTMPDVSMHHKHGDHTQIQSIPQTHKHDKAATLKLTLLPEHAQLLSSNTCSIITSRNAKPTHFKCLQVLCDIHTACMSKTSRANPVRCCSTHQAKCHYCVYRVIIESGHICICIYICIYIFRCETKSHNEISPFRDWKRVRVR